MNQTKKIHPVDEMLPKGRLFTLGLQHVLVMYSGAVAVPIMIGGALGLSKEEIAFLISADLFCCGIVTLLQCLGLGKYIGIRLPVIMAVTFAAVSPMLAIGASAEDPYIALRTIFGATIAAGIITTFLVPILGRLKRFFPPVVTGVIITSIGLSIIHVGVNWAAGGVGNPEYGSLKYLGVSLAVLIFILAIIRYCKGFLANIAVLLGMGFGFALAWFLGEVSFDSVGSASWFALIKPFHFGPPIFEFWSIATITVVTLITFIESIGMFLALGALVESPIDEKTLNRGLRVDSLGTLIGGLFNSFAHTSFSQNVGLVGVTGVKSRYVCAASGLILLAFGFIPKMAAFVASIPVFVLGGAGIVMFGMVMATGIKILATVDYKTNNHNLIIVAISLGMGMIPAIAPDFFHELPKVLAPFLHSGIMIATVWAVLLNIFFNAKAIKEEKEGLPDIVH